jgi:pantothenate kinase
MEMITRVWACQKFFYIYIFLYYTQVDKLVGDIYGDDYQGLGLSADTVASSFGKLVNSELREHVSLADLAASLVQVERDVLV